MTEGANGRGSLSLFLALTLALSSIFYYRILSFGSLESGGGHDVIALMWCPGAAALVTALVSEGTLRGLGWGWGPTRYQLWSYAIPILYSLGAYAGAWLTGLGGFYDREFAGRLATRLAERFDLVGLSPAGAVALYVPLAAGLSLPSACLAALGEEIGWRGFLVPQLARRTTFTNTALLSGAIWSVWHYPLLLFADYNAGTPAWYGLTCFSVMVVGISVVYAWMRLRSGSLWTAVLLHGSHNLFVQQILDPLTADTGPTRYVTGEFGIGLALAGAGVGYLFWRRRTELPGGPR